MTSSEFERMQEFAESINWDGLTQEEMDNIWADFDEDCETEED